MELAGQHDSRLGHFSRRLLTLIVHARDMLDQRRKKRRNSAALSSLSDHILRDIGREDIAMRRKAYQPRHRV